MKGDLVFRFADFDKANVFFVDHGHERAVVHFFYLTFEKHRHDNGVEQDHHEQNDAVVIDQRFLWLFDFIHLWLTSCMFINLAFALRTGYNNVASPLWNTQNSTAVFALEENVGLTFFPYCFP